jgi:hypothetical protein
MPIPEDRGIIMHKKNHEYWINLPIEKYEDFDSF